MLKVVIIYTYLKFVNYFYTTFLKPVVPLFLKKLLLC